MHRRRFLLASSQAALAAGLLPQVLSCRPGSEHPDDAAFLSLRDRYFLKALELNPVTATYLGGDGYDASLTRINGRLRDWRPEALEVERRFYREIEAARGRIPAESLSPQARIDHAVMGAQIAFVLRQSGERHTHQRIIDTYVAEPFRGIDWQIQGMTDEPAARRFGASAAEKAADSTDRGTEIEWRLVVERLRAIPAYLEAAQLNLAAGVQEGNLPDRRMIERDGIAGSKANADYFRKTLPESAAQFLGARPFAQMMLAEINESSRLAADAWERFAGFLLTTYDASDVTDRFAAGEEEYAWRLKHCLHLDRNLEDLFAYGAQQVAHYETELFAVAREVADAAALTLPWRSDTERRRSTRAVTEHLAKDSPRDDDELFQWYRDAGARAVEWGRQQRLFDIPADYQLEVTATPPVLRSSIDASYYPAPPFKKSGVGRFYLTPTDNNAAALRLNNRASIADTAIHEGFPGHDWHFKYMTRYASEISNIRWLTPGAVEDSSSMWEDSMAAEGWALYAEELMAEPAAGRPYGFYSAAERLYELQGQLLRAVRVRVDVGIHTGRMSYDDAVDYFVTHVAFYPGARAASQSDATAEALMAGAERAMYRYSKWPTQAVTYNLGKNEILALREALRQKQGDRFSARQFHERLMRLGTIPAGYVREVMLQEG